MQNEEKKWWMMMNAKNLDLEATISKGAFYVQARDKDSNELICECSVSEEDYSTFQLLLNPDFEAPFDLKITVKPGDTAYMLSPDFGDGNEFSMRITKEPVEVKVLAVNGSNDTDFTVYTKDASGNKVTIIQEAVFLDKKDAMQAYERAKSMTYHSWEDFKRDMSYVIQYNYRVFSPILYGEKLGILKDGSSVAAPLSRTYTKPNFTGTFKGIVRAKRSIVHMSEDGVVNVEVLTEGHPCYSSGDKRGVWLADFDKIDVNITPYGIKCEYNGEEVINMICNFKTIGSLVELDRVPNTNKDTSAPRESSETICIPRETFEQLRQKIKDKQHSLMDSLAVATGNGNDAAYNYLKSLELQCSAELRLLYHLENKVENIDNFVVC